MGWITYHRAAGETDRAHFERTLLTGTDYDIIACASRLTTFYAAVRTRSTGRVWALIVEMHRGRGDQNFGYKAHDDSVGPVQTDAPRHVLDALTPTDHPAALQWRRQCRDALEIRECLRGLQPGAVIVFKHPLAFAGSRGAARFEVTGRTRRGIRWTALTAEGSFPCRLPTPLLARGGWSLEASTAT